MFEEGLRCVRDSDRVREKCMVTVVLLSAFRKQDLIDHQQGISTKVSD